MLQSESWSSSSLAVPSPSRRVGYSLYYEGDELEERIARWFRLDINLFIDDNMIKVCLYSGVCPFPMDGIREVFFTTFRHHAG